MYSCPITSTLILITSTITSSTHSFSSKGISSHAAGMLCDMDACERLFVGSRRRRRK